MSLSRKRKQVPPASTSYKKPTADQVGPNQALLYIQAHEADIIRGTQAMLAAQSLEVVVSEAKPKGSRRQQVGGGLVQLGKAAEAGTRKRNDKDTKIIVHDDDDDNILNEWDNQDSRGDLWVDRYAFSIRLNHSIYHLPIHYVELTLYRSWAFFFCKGFSRHVQAFRVWPFPSFHLIRVPGLANPLLFPVDTMRAPF